MEKNEHNIFSEKSGGIASSNTATTIHGTTA